ncbi:hypothetical protein SRHO_G00211040 [Serrasalmus rhombeus]
MSKHAGKMFANTIKEKVASFKVASGIPVDGDSLAWSVRPSSERGKEENRSSTFSRSAALSERGGGVDPSGSSSPLHCWTRSSSAAPRCGRKRDFNVALSLRGFSI